jgi:hypothetical protein
MHDFTIPISTSSSSTSNTVPIGSIIAYLPGSFTAIDNVGYVNISQVLPSNWKVCDGRVTGAVENATTFITDADSPIFNVAGRYLPNLTDSRFLMGYTSNGLITIGGITGGNQNGLNNNTVTLTNASEATTNIPQHLHTINHTHTWSGGITGYANIDHNHGYTYYWAGGAGYVVPGLVATAGAVVSGNSTNNNINIDHTHNVIGSNQASGSGIPGDNVNYTQNYPTVAASPFSILPLYLKVVYIMRIK